MPPPMRSEALYLNTCTDIDSNSFDGDTGGNCIDFTVPTTVVSPVLNDLL